MERIRVEVPASCANLGSAFDVLGVAVDLYNTFEFEISERDTFVCEGRFCKAMDPSHVFRTLDYLFALLGVERPPLTVKEFVRIPPGLGLGSSASFVAASVLAMSELLNLEFDEAKSLELGCEIEGHPDNVAPALLGGCVLVKRGEGMRWLKLPWPKHWKIAVYLPSSLMSTEKARKILPIGYSRETVVDQIASVGFLVYGILNEDLEALRVGMRDNIHQKYRLQMNGDAQRVFEILKASSNGAVFLSGSGPAVGVVCEEDEELPVVAGTSRLDLRVTGGIRLLSDREVVEG